MRQLRKVNQVAYVRFASVYKEFKDVIEFMEVLEEFIQGRGGSALSPAVQLEDAPEKLQGGGEVKM